MLDQNLPIVIIYILAIAARDQETLETFVDSIQMQQKRQKIDTFNAIQLRTGALAKQEKLAYRQNEWEALAGISPSGSPSKEDYDPNVLQLVVGIIIFAFGGALLMPIFSLITQIAQLTIETHKEKREFDKIMSWINPTIAIADGSVAVSCEINGTDPNSAEMQKLRMKVALAIGIISAIVLIIAGIALAPFTGGSSAAIAVMVTISVIAGIIQLVCAFMELMKAEKELQIAQDRFAYNKLLALIEQLKMNLEVINQDIDLLVEMFASKMSDIRAAYERASQILKEYNDTKRAVAQNFRS
jgi:hypothetical protein